MLFRSTVTYGTTSTALTLGVNDYYVSATGSSNYTITLPTAVGITGRVYIVKSNNTGLTTIGTTSSQTIDGVTSKVHARYDSIQVVSNGTNWEIF